jgi:hypothetical protein
LWSASGVGKEARQRMLGACCLEIVSNEVGWRYSRDFVDGVRQGQIQVYRFRNTYHLQTCCESDDSPTALLSTVVFRRAEVDGSKSC